MVDSRRTFPLVWGVALALCQLPSPTNAFLQVCGGRNRVREHYCDRSRSCPRRQKLTPLFASQLEDLEISDNVEGSGDVAKFDTIVTVRYTGRFLEGEQFDESMISFKLGYGKVIDGCERGIRGMRVGGIRVLKIPSRMGFGPSGYSDLKIPPDADLEYTVELTSVASGPMAEAAANMGIGLDPDTVYLK